MSLRVIDIIEGTSVDGPGLRTSVYLAGCAHHCPGCHNPDTWNFDSGREISVEALLEIIDSAGLPVSLSGGDPLYQARELIALARELRRRGMSVWCWTGFTFEQLMDSAHAPDGTPEFLSLIDVLVDGPYIAALRNPDLMFRGSSNQRIIDMAASLSCGRPILHPLNDGPDIPVF